MGIRKDRYTAMVPTVTGALRLKGRVHADEARLARAHTTRRLKIHPARPDDHRRYDRRRALWRQGRSSPWPSPALLNEEARALEADGVDVVQFDEPAFNVYMDEVKDWGIAALHRAAEGLTCTTAVHICYGYGIKANLDWKATLGGEWRQYEEIFPALAASRIDQVSIEAKNSRVPMELIALLKGKDVLVGVIDVASDTVETPEEVARHDRGGDAASCRPSASSPAPIAAWRRCGATSPSPSSRRSARAPGWRAPVSREVSGRGEDGADELAVEHDLPRQDGPVAQSAAEDQPALHLRRRHVGERIEVHSRGAADSASRSARSARGSGLRQASRPSAFSCRISRSNSWSW